jgi:hypothetical protein
MAKKDNSSNPAASRRPTGMNVVEAQLRKEGKPLNLKNYLGVAGLRPDDVTPEALAGFPPEVQQEFNREYGTDNPEL